MVLSFFSTQSIFGQFQSHFLNAVALGLGVQCSQSVAHLQFDVISIILEVAPLLFERYQRLSVGVTFGLSVQRQIGFEAQSVIAPMEL